MDLHKKLLGKKNSWGHVVFQIAFDASEVRYGEV